jgi:hypothetical protein
VSDAAFEVTMWRNCGCYVSVVAAAAASQQQLRGLSAAALLQHLLLLNTEVSQVIVLCARCASQQAAPVRVQRLTPRPCGLIWTRLCSSAYGSGAIKWTRTL